jgi:predicted nucleic-acid-binding protein
MNKKSLDTNIILRYILGDVPDQLRKIENFLAKEKTTHRFSIADQVFVEVEYVLSAHYGFGRADIVDALTAILDQSWVMANKALFQKVFPGYILDKRVSLVDLMLLGYAELNEATPLITFDKNLSKISKDIYLLK